MTQLRKEAGLRDSNLRPKLIIDTFASITYDDKLYMYQLVQFNHPKRPNQHLMYEKNGWEIVSSEDSLLDDRTNAPDKEVNKSKMSPVTKRLSDSTGVDCVLMRILKTKYQANLDAEKAERMRVHNVDKKISKSSGVVRVTDRDISSDDIN